MMVCPLSFLSIYHVSQTGHYRGLHLGTANRCKCKKPQEKPAFSGQSTEEGAVQHSRSGNPCPAPYPVAAGELVPPAQVMPEKIRWETSFLTPQPAAAADGSTSLPCCPQQWHRHRPGRETHPCLPPSSSRLLYLLKMTAAEDPPTGISRNRTGKLHFCPLCSDSRRACSTQPTAPANPILQ